MRSKVASTDISIVSAIRRNLEGSFEETWQTKPFRRVFPCPLNCRSCRPMARSTYEAVRTYLPHVICNDH